MDKLISIAIPILTLLLSIMIKYANLPESLIEADPIKYLSVEFDLVLISLSILLGSHISIINKNKSFVHSSSNIKSKPEVLFVPLFVVFVVTILCFCLEKVTGLSFDLIQKNKKLFEVIIPNMLGVISVTISVYSVQKT